MGNGALYELIATISVDGRKLPHQMYFGKLEPQESARRTLAFTDIRYTDTGTELPFTVTFNEANDYDPPPLLGKLAILKPDPAFLIDHITDLDGEVLRYFLDQEQVATTDICRAVLLRAQDLGIAKVINLLENNSIDKNVVEELVRIDNLPYRVNNIIIENFTTMSNTQLRFFLDREYVSATDIYQSTLRRAAELGISRMKRLLEDNLIDKNVVDKLVHFDKLPYSIDDLIYFAEKKAITREYLELALLDGKVDFQVSHLVELGRRGYLSRQVAEAFYSNGIAFTVDQVQELASMDLFTLPEVLYTYTIDDGDSATSTGNGDGMIQIREGVDFQFIIKNASRYDIEDVQVVLQQNATAIDLFSEPQNLAVFKADDTMTMDATIGVKSSFKGSSLPMQVVVKSPQFGTMLDKTIDVPVGQTVGSPVLALNKQVAARDSITVRSGASDKSPRIASLAKGAVFTAVGELNGWYKVGVYGRSGWIQKEETQDYSQPTESSFIVANLRESAQGLVGDSSEAGVYGELAFVNARPVLVIVSPRSNEDVYNAAEMDIQAVDRSFGISKIDVRINGAPLSDAAARGLRSLGGVVNRELRKTIALTLKKGKNVVEVTAYNSRNVASDTQTLHLNSLGIKNPPSMYVLSVGVSRYANKDQNLQYAKSDAEKIAALFKKQDRADIYKSVNIKTLYDEEATRANIKDGVNYFLAEARKDDVAVFYFAGHGITDARGDYYLMGHDGNMDRPSSLGYKNSDLEEDLQSSVYAEKVLVLLDSCRSGQATGRRGDADIDAVVNQLVLASGYNVISAARGNEAAWERSDWGGGAFTYAIMQSLEGGMADANKDGFVSVNELEDSVSRQVRELTSDKQNPTFGAGDRSNEPYSFYQVK